MDKKTYQRYRQAGKELNRKIMHTSLDDRAIQHAAKALGLLGGRRTIVADQDELDVLMDYALYEYHVSGKNAIERYYQEVGGANLIEQELLEAMVSSSTSLFQVSTVSKRTYSFKLNDLVNPDNSITVVDINFSHSVVPGLLIFIRPITVKGTSMTSGMAFVFPGSVQDELLRRGWRTGRPHSPRADAARRYVTLFKLSKRLGFQVQYE